MINYTYKTKGVCSRQINLTIDDDGRLTSVSFDGGCNGNTKGVSALVEGMQAKEAAERLKGINCGFKGTSCPDQLSRAILEALENS